MPNGQIKPGLHWAIWPFGALTLCALAAGCSYTVRVRNDNGQPITARMIQTDALMKDWILAEQTVAPGETATLGPARTLKGTVQVEADPTHGHTASPVRRTILPGSHAFRLGLDLEGEHQRLMLRSADWRDLDP